ncbi:hypothetical protein C8J57DRAFT_550098 [Mycena rebaudengoi]|nr:hypothetical protein C8J57DRAFT_550098 [Mycena rebaudengoi]
MPTYAAWLLRSLRATSPASARFFSAQVPIVSYFRIPFAFPSISSSVKASGICKALSPMAAPSVADVRTSLAIDIRAFPAIDTRHTQDPHHCSSSAPAIAACALLHIRPRLGG